LFSAATLILASGHATLSINPDTFINLLFSVKFNYPPSSRKNTVKEVEKYKRTEEKKK
jgi:hypothetical protein